MQVRLSDPAVVEEFLEFLWRSGFIAEQETRDTVRVSVPFAAGRDRTGEDAELFLRVWMNIALRVWRELRPQAEALVVPDAEPARRALG